MKLRGFKLLGPKRANLDGAQAYVVQLVPHFSRFWEEGVRIRLVVAKAQTSLPCQTMDLERAECHCETVPEDAFGFTSSFLTSPGM